MPPIGTTEIGTADNSQRISLLLLVDGICAGFEIGVIFNIWLLCGGCHIVMSWI